MDDKSRQELIESRIDTTVAGALPMTELGVAFRHMGEVMEFAKMMAVAGAAVPAVFRGNPGACLAVAIKAQHFGMEPFSFASKCYFVNDNLAYEAQLIHAIIIKRAGLLRRPVIEYAGEGDNLVCTVSLHLPEPDGIKVYESPKLVDINPKNSPLWKSDKKQQIAYYSVRAAARRHIPDVIMGMYDIDEMAAVAARDVNPRPAKADIGAALANGKQVEATYVDKGGRGEPGNYTAESAKNDPRTADPDLQADGTPRPADAMLAQDGGEGGANSPNTFEDSLIADLKQALAGAEGPLLLKVVADEFQAAIEMASDPVAATLREMIAVREREISP